MNGLSKPDLWATAEVYLRDKAEVKGFDSSISDTWYFDHIVKEEYGVIVENW